MAVILPTVTIFYPNQVRRDPSTLETISNYNNNKLILVAHWVITMGAFQTVMLSIISCLIWVSSTLERRFKCRNSTRTVLWTNSKRKSQARETTSIKLRSWIPIKRQVWSKEPTEILVFHYLTSRDENKMAIINLVLTNLTGSRTLM